MHGNISSEREYLREHKDKWKEFGYRSTETNK